MNSLTSWTASTGWSSWPRSAHVRSAYYSQLGEGLLEYVGPLVETRSQEKPLSISLREIKGRLLSVESIEA